jgi:endonuclease/exonuclease/phosphatase family metal-dependent hydrolase
VLPIGDPCNRWQERMGRRFAYVSCMHDSTRAALALACAVAVAAATRGHHTASASEPWRSETGRVTPAASDPGPGVRVMTFNIQHGIDGTQKYNLQTSIDAIARINPDIVGLVEVTRNHPYYNCDDQPKLIAEGLSRATGRRWTWVYQRQWFTPNTECADSGRGDGKETEGLGFLAPEPLEPPKFIELWNTGLGLTAQTARLPGVPITITHLTAGATNAPSREKQLAKLLPWMQSFGAPRILLGDFNIRAESPEMQPVYAAYRDVWADSVKAGTARGRLEGLTHKRSRIDYILYAPEDRLELLWAETVDTVALIGKEASDHRPLVAAFRLK